jgi:hypothetical protein
MSRPLLLRLAAALVMITCVGHTVGTFMPIPPEQTAMHATVAVMKATMIPMPVGDARSYMQILDGNNLVSSLFMLMCALQLVAISSLPQQRSMKGILILIALALAAFAFISAFYFFPVPAILTGAAALLIFYAALRAQPVE